MLTKGKGEDVEELEDEEELEKEERKGDHRQATKAIHYSVYKEIQEESR